MQALPSAYGRQRCGAQQHKYPLTRAGYALTHKRLDSSFSTRLSNDAAVDFKGQIYNFARIFIVQL